MKALEEPFGAQASDERVFFVSPQPVKHEIGEIPAEDLGLIIGELFARVNNNPDMLPTQYAAVAKHLANECFEGCRFDTLYDERTKLPSLTNDQCEYFLGVAAVFARDIRGRNYADEVESRLFPSPETSRNEVMWQVLHS